MIVKVRARAGSPGWSVPRQAYCSTLDLEALLASALRKFCAAAQALSASLMLGEHGTLHCRRYGDALHVDREEHGLGERCEALVPNATGGPSKIGSAVRGETWVGISYAAGHIGELRVCWGQGVDEEAVAHRCRAFAGDLGLLIQRHRIRRWSKEELGAPLTFLGLSPELRVVEHQIERSCRTRLPVMIRGEFGTEVLTAAVALHCGASFGEGELQVLNCAALGPEDMLERLNEYRGERTSLFLRGIDELTTATQRALMSCLPALLSLPLEPDGACPRLIASTTQDLAQLCREGSFSPTLLAALDVLEIVIPPLRDRSADIADIVDYVLQQHHEAHAGPSAPPRACSEELLKVLAAYPWPGNFLELERVILQLAVMSEGNPIGLVDALRYTGRLIVREEEEKEEEEKEEEAQPISPSPKDLDAWIAVMDARDYARFEELHEGLQRALVYMSQNYQERVTLSMLGKSAHLSNSHLSHLFKSSVGINFKTLLARLRVEKAKRLLTLAGHPRRITDIASEAGFGDLSHFEKTFRRFVNMCPREYRNSSVRPSSHHEELGLS